MTRRPALSTLIPLILIGGLVAACSPGASSPPPTSTPVATATYHSKILNLSFNYPGGWKVAKKPYEANIPMPAAVLKITPAADSTAQLEITVDSVVTHIPDFPNGKIAKDPNGPEMLHYRHLRVSGYPAMEIGRFGGKIMDGLFTLVATRTRTYQIRMITGEPPFKQSTINGYETIVGSLKLSFS